LATGPLQRRFGVGAIAILHCNPLTRHERHRHKRKQLLMDLEAEIETEPERSLSCSASNPKIAGQTCPQPSSGLPEGTQPTCTLFANAEQSLSNDRSFYIFGSYFLQA
jgi:hypothetical protein